MERIVDGDMIVSELSLSTLFIYELDPDTPFHEYSVVNVLFKNTGGKTITFNHMYFFEVSVTLEEVHLAIFASLLRRF